MEKSRSYRRSLGLIELVSLGVGGTVGSGIFVVPGIAAQMTGPFSLLAWVIVALSASCVLLSLASISYHFTASSGFYSLFESVFGVRIAAPLMVIYCVSSILGIATIAAGIGQYVSFFSVPSILLVEIAILAFFLCLNCIGIALSGITENFLTLLKIVPLVIIAIVLLPFVRPENLVPAAPLTMNGLLATVIIVYWPFTGFEICAIPVEETKDPALIRRSLLLVMLVVVTLYLVLNTALIGSVGSAVLSSSPAPVAAAAGAVFPHAGEIVAFIGIIAMLSALNAYIIATSRILHSLGERFSVQGIRHLSRQGTPVATLTMACGAGMLLLLISNRFDTLASLSVVTTLVPYIFFCLAAWILLPAPRSRLVAAAGIFSTAAILILYMFM
ncbi:MULTISPECIES: APC family permease [unclassified Methanoregula]|uniref:APC family permease n=1 Tax=unclassified Methanoregula TaxID=2649730 RepID=UPI0009D1A44B|nr:MULTISPECIES: amino acid permease [unclassified Methanoregula]OPX62066.1 MAG: putative transporter [Methanoregula sp. PtaB.Bin085]OPY36557.1 MAG: putative transporter [Methanoregula sp. PtaU1.Bin006]